MKINFSVTSTILAALLAGSPAIASIHSQSAPVSIAHIDPLTPSEKSPFALRTDRALGGIRLAHAILVKAAPDKDAVITDVPEEILLIFNDAVGEEFLALAVVDESGKRVDKHDAKLDFTDRSHLRASVEKLPPGRYMVRYRVLSADGHVVSGKYYFQVQGK